MSPSALGGPGAPQKTDPGPFPGQSNMRNQSYVGSFWGIWLESVFPQPRGGKMEVAEGKDLKQGKD